MSYRKTPLIPLLFILSATALLVSLGVWQLQRKEWKEAWLKDIEAAQEMPALGTLPPAGSGEAVEYRSAVLTGRLLTEHVLHAVGKQSGGHVWLIPLKLEDSDQTVLAAYGWYPQGAKVVLPEGPVTLAGVLRAPWKKRMFSPENQPQGNLWFTEDIPAMAEKTGLALEPWVLDLHFKPNLRNDHLGYAITWFLLAAAGVGMFAVYVRQGRR